NGWFVFGDQAAKIRIRDHGHIHYFAFAPQFDVVNGDTTRPRKPVSFVKQRALRFPPLIDGCQQRICPCKPLRSWVPVAIDLLVVVVTVKSLQRSSSLLRAKWPECVLNALNYIVSQFIATSLLTIADCLP